MKVSDYISHAIHQQGIRHVFELSGGMIAHMLDSLHRHGVVRLVSMRHEQAAAFAADGHARMTGLPGVAMATSGPGAINLLTGIGSCYFDSTPAVFITGQVNRNEQKRERPIRQLGFQETDIVSMARPIVKQAWRIETPEEVPSALNAAFRVALEGRRGPVLVDIPMDVQRADIENAARPPIAETPAPDVDLEPVRRTCEKSLRPLILAGGGIRSAGAVDAFRALVDASGIPVVHSLLATDVLPYRHPSRAGMIGTYGNRWANRALMRSDLLIVIGSRLDVRQTGSQVSSFKAGREIFHFDCEPGEINNRVPGCTPILGELKATLPALGLTLGGLRAHLQDRLETWSDEIRAMRAERLDVAELDSIPGINPKRLMHELSALAGAAAAYVIDVGQHQMWAAQSLEIGPRQRFITSGGMGSMGFALPASVGVALAAPGQAIVVIAGDAGFQCNLQELETIKNLSLPQKILVLDNGCHGMVRQFQETYFESRYVSTVWGYSAPDFAGVACAYGIPSASVSKPEELGRALEWLWQSPLETALLHVRIDPSANAWPRVQFGKPLDEMEP